MRYQSTKELEDSLKNIKEKRSSLYNEVKKLIGEFYGKNSGTK